MPPEIEYASALVYLLDRDKQRVSPCVCYPITRIELQEFQAGIVTTRIFVVDENGKWVEAS